MKFSSIERNWKRIVEEEIERVIALQFFCLLSLRMFSRFLACISVGFSAIFERVSKIFKLVKAFNLTIENETISRLRINRS